MFDLTLRAVATGDLPLSATRVTLVNLPDRWHGNHLTIHAATPTCQATTFPPPRQQVLDVGTLADLAGRHTGLQTPGDIVAVCRHCTAPEFVAHRAELDTVIRDTHDYRQLQFALFCCRKEPTLAILSQVATGLLRTTGAVADTTSPAVAEYLRDRLPAAYAAARTARDLARSQHPHASLYLDGPWVAVGILRLDRAWEMLEWRAGLAFSPGNIFDHPVDVDQASVARPGEQAVLAVPAPVALAWTERRWACAQRTDVPLTAADLPHLGLMTRLWVANPDLELPDVVTTARGIAAPAPARPVA